MSSVWVQLYYEGGIKPEGNPVKIKIQEDVADLAKEVKKDMAEELTHCSSAKLLVYRPGTTSFTKLNSMKPDKKLSELIDELKKNTTPPTSAKHPLVVVAPDPKQAYGKKCFRFFSFASC